MTRRAKLALVLGLVLFGAAIGQGLLVPYPGQILVSLCLGGCGGLALGRAICFPNL